jgi:hypothetical protein
VGKLKGMSYDTIPDPSKKSRQQLYEVVPENEEEELYGDVNRLDMTELLQVLPVLETQVATVGLVFLSGYLLKSRPKVLLL